MIFNSVEFFIFFPITVSLYFLSPHKYRWVILLLASCFFYMAFIPAYIIILAFLIVVDYFLAIKIEKSCGKEKKLFLVISILSSCFVLFGFKYFDFFNANILAIANFLDWNYPIKMLNLVLPIGLSFHTFQSLSYVIEVYKGKYKAEKNLGIYSLYVMFFPQLVAGPIERPQNLLGQFYEKHNFEYNNVTGGLKLMALGLFKKIVLADRLAMFTSLVFSNVMEYKGLELIIGVLFFAFQIYFDFSGYSDIAIGSAYVMGFKLKDNFRNPYFSRSIADFWRRWHISLSSWFRDYIYFPLGGKRIKKSRWYFNLLFTFFISGLWHGASWGFIIWGTLHGFYYIFGEITKKFRRKVVEFIGITKLPKTNKYLQIFLTFSLVCFSWIFFRANNLKDAFYIIGNLFSGMPLQVLSIYSNLSNFNFTKTIIFEHPAYELLILFCSFIFLGIIYFLQKNNDVRALLSKEPIFVRWGFYYAIIFGIIGSCI